MSYENSNFIFKIDLFLIIENKLIIPEFLQFNCQPKFILKELFNLLKKDVNLTLFITLSNNINEKNYL